MKEGDNLVDWDGRICRGGRAFSGQKFTLTLLCLHYMAINMKPHKPPVTPYILYVILQL